MEMKGGESKAVVLRSVDPEELHLSWGLLET